MFKILTTEYTIFRTGGERESDEPYSSHKPEHKDATLEYVKIPKNAKECYGPIEVSFNPKVGQKVYVIEVRYQTGNTFGYSTGNPHIVGILDDEELANKIEKYINKDSDECNLDKFENYGIDTYKCWSGYFERLESCFVTEMVVEKE